MKGLDAKKFHAASAISSEEFYTFASQISDEERFKNVRKWTPVCPSCNEKNEFQAVFRRQVGNCMLILG